MKLMKNERGSVLVFATLMIVLLLVMVGIGLDTGWITYVRGLGQPAVDAAALAGASAIPTGNLNEVNSRVAAFNTTNDYVNSKSSTAQIQTDGTNVTLVNWDSVTGDIVKVTDITKANGVRVALEQTNPYGGSPNTAINAPLFLTPLFNVLGVSMAKTANISVSAVAVAQGYPSMPIALSGCPPPGACKNVAPDGSGGTECQIAQYPSDPDPTKANNSGWTSFTIQPASPSTIGPMIGEPATCSGKIPGVDVGTNICLHNGSATGPILGGIQDFYSTNGNGLSGQSNPPFDPADCGLVPVVAAGLTNFNHCDEPIKSFARLCIRDVVKTGSPKFVYGDITCNQSIYDPKATACYTPRLVRDKNSSM